MARTGIGELGYYLALAGVGVVTYRLALDGKLGTDAKKAAIDLWEALHPGKTYSGADTRSAAPAAPAPPSGPYAGLAGMKGKLVPLTLVDLGRVPVAYDVDADTIVQNVPGGNRYRPGDIFRAGDELVQFVGSGALLHISSGATFRVQDFVPEA